MSADGKTGFVTRTQAKISSEEDMRRVHRLRAANDAIVVGVGTVLSDDPKLTVKGEYAKGKNPIRVILDSKGRTPKGAHVLDGSAPTIVFTNKRCARTFAGAEVVRCGHDLVDLTEMLEALWRRGVSSVLVEGGETVIWSFLNAGLADQFKVFVGSLVLGGKGGPTPAGGPGVRRIEDALRLKLRKTTRLGSGVLLEYVPAVRK